MVAESCCLLLNGNFAFLLRLSACCASGVVGWSAGSWSSLNKDVCCETVIRYNSFLQDKYTRDVARFTIRYVVQMFNTLPPLSHVIQ